jgi:predicted small secreted protein
MKKLLLKVAAMAALFTIAGCGTHDGAEDDVKWSDDNGGTLEVVNGSSKDIVVFHGQYLTESGLMGGVKAGTTKLFDVSKFPDFEAGGYVILKGMSRDQYNINRYNLSEARVEFRSMATYRRGTKYRIQIDLNGGENGFKVNNVANIGVELRRNSPDGEKVTYLGPNEVNNIIYTSSTNSIRLFPVYVYYNSATGEISTLKTADIYNTINVIPRPLAGANSMQVYTVPDNTQATWDDIRKTVKFPYAYIKVRNSMTNQEAAFLSRGGTDYLFSQNGYDAIGSGETLMYEIEGSDMEGGIETALNINIYNFRIPILVAEEIEEEIDVEKEIDGETVIVKEVVKNKQLSNPKLKNGYDYEVVVKGQGRDPSGYEATIVESAEQRDISSVIGIVR